MNAPAHLEDWEAQRAPVRATLWQLLGEMPPRVLPDVTRLATIERAQFTIEKIAFDNGIGATVFGYVLVPKTLTGPAPAVLYNHYHGFKYELGKREMFEDRVTVPPLGPALAQAGYVVLAIDAYAFGERQQQGPAGDRESGAGTELALFKQFLWQGRTLWGMMLRDDLLALDYLCARPEVDPARVAATGMSLGGSRTTWLAALDARIKVAIPVAQMTRYQNLLAAGNLNDHGIYYYVPGALASGFDMEQIVSLMAPRAQCILIGDSDALSPIDGVRTIDHYARHIYDLYGASDHFETIIYPGVGHDYTPGMYRALFDTLARFL